MVASKANRGKKMSVSKWPLLLKKFERNLKRILPEKKQKLILKLCNNQNTFENTDVNILVDHLSLS